MAQLVDAASASLDDAVGVDVEAHEPTTRTICFFQQPDRVVPENVDER
jgi:hypothetical protein